MVDGTVIMDNQQILIVNEKEVISEVEKIGEEIKKGRLNNVGGIVKHIKPLFSQSLRSNIEKGQEL
jgi:hypothetical protein